MKNIIDAALGRTAPELVIKNCRVADVFRGRLCPGDVAIADGRVVGIGSYEGKEVIDAGGMILAPGYIESHVHIESSMLTPSRYAAVVAPAGVTTVIADPHEIANVRGVKGIEYMLASAEGVPVDIEFMVPSCVPAAPFERGGAALGSKETRRLMDTGKFLGLGEMMNFPGVLGGDGEVLAKLDSANIRDGHCPGLSGKELNAYAAAGVRTDHECVTAEELYDRVSAGMYVQIREGSQARELDVLSKGIDRFTARRLLFCTDDRNLSDITRSGTIHNCVRRAVKELGIDPFDALAIATINAAQCYGLKGKGAVAPGWTADLILCDEIGGEIKMVFKNGRLIAREGRALFDAEGGAAAKKKEKSVRDTVRMKKIKAKQLELPFEPSMPVIGVKPGSLVTTREYADSAEELTLCAVIERHKGTGRMGRAYVSGFGLKGGAIAQTIAHDSHNVTVSGDNAADMALAVNALGKEGGIAVAQGGEVTCFFPLPIAGLMTDLPAAEALERHKELEQAIAALGCRPGIDPSMLLAFLALPVIPELKLTCDGLFDVTKFEFVTKGEG